MAAIKFRPTSALKEHMLAGHRVSPLEAMLLFGVRHPNEAVKRMRQDGFMVKYQEVPLAKILRRINEYALCKVPSSLPHKELVMTEYWISR